MSAAPAVAVLSQLEAHRLTARIRASLEAAAGDLIAAWQGRAWQAMGHADWPAYLDAEFGEVLHVRLPVDVRRQRVAEMRAAGMSKRAIAPALGVSTGTVSADLAALGPAPEGAVVIALDGSRRAASPAPIVEPSPARPTTRAERVVELVAARGADGMTVRELCRSMRVHHGIASGALSRLDRQGRVQRTTVYRDGCAAYVVPAGPPSRPI